MKAFIPYKLTGEVGFAGIKANLKPVDPQGLASSVTYIAPHPCLYQDEIDEGLVVFGESYKKVELHVVIRERVIPAASVRDYVKEKEKEYCFETDSEQAPPALRREWKEDYLTQKLPTAPIKTTVVPVLFLIDEGYVLIGTSSQKVAEHVITQLHHTLGNFNVMPFNTTHMASWLWKQTTDVTNGNAVDMVEYEDSVTGMRVRYSGDYKLSEARVAIMKNPNVRIRSAMFDLANYRCVINDKAVVSQIKADSGLQGVADKTVDDKRGQWHIDVNMCVEIMKLLKTVEEV